ncbi:MAG: ABC transporter ATP-binding protein [Syntrophales bacterium]
MKSWRQYLKAGLSRKRTPDRIHSTPSSDRALSELYRQFSTYAGKHKTRFIVGIGLVFLTAGLSFPLPMITRYLIDDVIMNRQLCLLAPTILIIIAITAADRLLSLYQQHYFDRFDQEVILDIQSSLLERVFHYPKKFFDRIQTGYLMNRLESDVQGMGWFFSSTMVGIMENTVRFVGGFCFLLYLDWRLTMVMIAVLPALIFVARYFSDRLLILSNENMETQAMISGQFQESLISLPLIKAFAKEVKTMDQLVTALKKGVNISIEQGTVNALANAAINSLPGIARALVLFIGAYWVITGHWSLGSLFAYQAYLGYVFGPAQFLATANLQMQSALASANRVSHLFDLVLEENYGHGNSVKNLHGDVEFRGVCFAYDERKPVLEDINFSIKAGERIAIAGPSGVGKTTLVSLLLLFYKPTSGEIYFDSRPAAEYDVQSLREALGYVPQQHWFLSGTIMENITYGHPGAAMSEIAAAARIAGIHDFIETLPQGYLTVAGERGVTLSEGQKQRISIARALLKNPDILLLDEPIAALDGRTGKSILSALWPAIKGKTVIIVSNQTEFLKNADRILLIQDSRLTAVGVHEELMSANPYYASLIVGADK